MFLQASWREVLCLQGRKSTAGSWESNEESDQPSRWRGSKEKGVDYQKLLPVWEIHPVLLAEEVFWLVEKPGLMWPQGSELDWGRRLL